MAQENKCPQCGAQMPPDAPEGLCPKCLMKAVRHNDVNATLEESHLIEGPGTKIGRYELLSLIGEGGMGLVYLAEQKEPVKRKVALKIVKLGMDTKQVVARFEAERQALALLDHPNIAHVFDAGTTEAGRPYFVMEYVKGMSITRYCDDRKLNIEKRLRLFEQVCEGIHHAHQKGIIHRDIKPSNILVSVHGDRAVPKIIDFGIAKATARSLTDKTVFTCQGQLLGTPEYMSPEQVDLATQDIDTRSDIYSLGVLLYELMAGVLPFEEKLLRSGGFAEVQRTIREQEPASPSIRLTNLGEQAKTIAASRGTQVIALARRLHRELEWIPLKAMRKDRCRRYKSASEMTDDIRNYLNGNPLIAGPETAIYRVNKFVHKHAGSVATVALVAAVIILGLVISIWQAKVATDAKSEALRAKAEKDRQAQIAVEERDNALAAQRQAERQRQRAEVSEQQAQNLLYAANMNLGQHAWEQNNMIRLRQSLEETATYPDRGFEWYYWQRQAHLEIRTYRGHTDGIWSVAFSPDGQRIVTASQDGTTKVWEVNSGKELLTLHYASLFLPKVAFSPDGQRILTTSADAKIWNATSGEELITFPGQDNPIISVAFSPDGRRIVTGCVDATAKVWEADSGKQLLTLQGHSSRIWSVAFSPDGQRIATSGDDATAKVWEANSGKELLTFKGHSEPIWSTEFSPNGQLVITGSYDGTAKVWEADSGKEVLSLKGDRTGITSVAFSPDGQQVVTGGESVNVWEVASGKKLLSLQGHGSIVWSIAFSPDGRKFVTGSQDSTAKLWDVAGHKEQVVLKGHNGVIYEMVFSPDGRELVTASADHTTKIWDAESGKELSSLEGHSDEIRSVAFSRDGQRLCTGSADRTAKVWEVASGRVLLTLNGHSDAISSVAFSPNGRWIATGSDDTTAKIWEAGTGKELLTLKGHNEGLRSVAFAPDGLLVATASVDNTAKVWDAASGKELYTLSGHSRSVWCATFSPNGERIVTISYDATAKLWEVTSGRELLTFKGHGAPIRSVAFSPDSRRIITGSNDATAKIWEAGTGKELLTLKGHDDIIRSVAFSPDGRQVVTGSYDNTAKIWESASAEQVIIWQQEERAASERLAAFQRERAEAARRDKALIAQDLGVIKQWLVLAPLAFASRDDATVRAALNHQQFPQEAMLRPRAGERVKVGEIERTWEEVQQEDDMINFGRLVGKVADYSVAYAVCYIDSDVDQTDLVMKVGGSDALKIYLNAGEICRQTWWQQDHLWNTADVTEIQLKAGLNVLVLKVVNQEKNWQASIRLTDAAGQPVKGIRVTLDPPEQARQ